MDSQVIDKKIIIEGAEMHNLKNIDLSIPKKKLVVVKNGDHSLSNSKHLKILLRELKGVIKNFI